MVKLISMNFAELLIIADNVEDRRTAMIAIYCDILMHKEYRWL